MHRQTRLVRTSPHSTTRLHSATQVAPYRPFHTTNIIKKEIDLNNIINNTIKKTNKVY